MPKSAAVNSFSAGTVPSSRSISAHLSKSSDTSATTDWCTWSMGWLASILYKIFKNEIKKNPQEKLNLSSLLDLRNLLGYTIKLTYLFF